MMMIKLTKKPKYAGPDNVTIFNSNKRHNGHNRCRPNSWPDAAVSTVRRHQLLDRQKRRQTDRRPPAK